MLKVFLRNLINFTLRAKYTFIDKVKVGEKTKLRHSILEANVSIGSECNITNSSIGRYSYLANNCYLPSTKVGAFCSIASHTILAAGNHPSNYLSTSPVTYKNKTTYAQGFVNQPTYQDEYKYVDDKQKFFCEIGNDVWIATRVTLVCGRNGLRIGNGAIVRSGSVVTKDIPPYAIVQGVPAHIIGYRFETEIIEKIEKLSWWNKDDKWIKAHAQYFSDVKKLLEHIEEE